MWVTICHIIPKRPLTKFVVNQGQDPQFTCGFSCNLMIHVLIKKKKITKAVCHGYNTMSHIVNVAATFIVRLLKRLLALGCALANKNCSRLDRLTMLYYEDL